MPVGYFLILVFAVLSFGQQNLSTPYDLIRPVWQLTWDSTVFDRFDTTITIKRNMVPKNRTPAAYEPNALIPDTLNQAYLDAINVRMSPIRVNQAGYLVKDTERKFYFVGSASAFEVVDSTGKPFSPKYTGTFQPSGTTTSSDWTIIAGTNAATNDQNRYKVTTTGPSGAIQVGHLPLDLPIDQRLRIKVDNHISSTFIISERVYSMVRSATLKFYGINRSGDSESWFHPASHTKDGGGKVVGGTGITPKEGALSGGWYDCGDHLKESQTQAPAFMALAVMASTNPNADEDNYDYNHGKTGRDGIPDLLREAKHGADFVLKSYDLANGVIDNMALSVGNFGADHGWWGRPENQDFLPTTVTGRGGPHERDVRLGELGSNISGQFAAGLALLSKDYATYDPIFAAKALKVAKEMYDFSKSLAQGQSSYGGGKPFVNNTTPAAWSTPAYNGNNEYFDDLALASVCLLYATQDPAYLNDALVSRTLNTTPAQQFADGAGFFDGGWFVTNDKGFLKNGKNTSWANAYTYALYALYKLILATPERATLYGINETKRLEYIEDVIANMIYNVSDMSGNGSASIVLPSGAIGWKGTTVKYDPTWYTMFTDQTWIYNRYQAGNIFEVLAYADVAKDLNKYNLPTMGSPDWKAEEMYQLGINQLNYMLGVNPWDVSFLLGIGDKNDAHPHHRASNPEGKNVAGANYKYRPPTGALFGGIAPGATNSWVPSTRSWEDYHLSETCIDATAIFIGSGMLTSMKIDKSKAPKIEVEIRHVSMDSAMVNVKLDVRGTASLFYGTSENDLKAIASPDNNIAGVEHEIILRELKNGTTYYFFAGAFNEINENNMTMKYLVDSTQTPYSFTTLNSIESALIENVTVCNVSADTAEIMWYTPNGEYESKVYWDTLLVDPSQMRWNTGSKNADVSGIPTKFHYVKIGGLKEKKTYYFAVESNGEMQSVDIKGVPLQFTTPVTQYDFSVRTYQYHWADMSGININVFNNEARAFDSLTVRLYMRGNDDLYNDIGIRMDICQAYDEAGFNKACSPETITELTTLFRLTHPIKIEDTYDATSGTWQWYFPIPLGSTVIKSSSRFRIDVLLDRRSRWAPYLDLMNAAPDKKIYCQAGSSWYSPSNLGPTSTLTKNPGDWSWAPHSRATGDYADYPGMPCLSKDEGDTDFEAAPINPYVTVYRKNEFVWGYSPSYTEMTTKRAKYDISLTLDAPFNVSNGSHVEIDQSGNTVYVKGTAKVTEGGFINRIWANGTEVTNISSAAKYNMLTDMWDLNIPVKMTIGSNKIDITVFAGPDPTCLDCANNGSCDFENRNFFVEFTKGNASASNLRIVNASDIAISSPADPNATSFYIYVGDKDKANYKGDIYALVINSRQKDTLKVKLDPESGVPGSFRSTALISAVSKTPNARNQNTEISFFGGDTIQVIYIDPEDEEDTSRQSFYAKATYPTPQKVLAEDLNCDGIVDNLNITFSAAFDASITFDSLWVSLKATETASGDSFKVYLTQDLIGKSVLDVPLSRATIPPTPAPEGYITAFLKTNGVVSKETAEITDGIVPTLMSVTVLENPDPRSPEDTVKISFSEKVTLGSLSSWPLIITDQGGNNVSQTAISVSGKATTDDGGKSYLYVVTGNNAGNLMKPGFIASIPSTFIVTDAKLNKFNPLNACQLPVAIAETPKPVPLKLAEMRDYTGDGYPDEIFLRFSKKLRDKDMLDSFAVDWGSPSLIKNFKPDSWVHTYEVSDPYYTYLGHLDTLTNGTIVNVITDSTLTQDTVSIITIKISATQSYELGATAGSYNGYGKIKPRLGPEGGFFDKSYTLIDKAPPIILMARKTSSSNLEVLEVDVSEVLKVVDGEYYLERKRGSETTYFVPSSVAGSQKKHAFIYNDSDPSAVRIGDYIRLVPSNTLSKFTDIAGNYPGDENPWVQVKGSVAEKTSFKVTMQHNLTQPNSSEVPYNGVLPNADEHFRLTILSADKEAPLAKGNGKLTSTLGEAPYDTNTYKHGGPTFIIEASVPSALSEIDGTRTWAFQINFEAFLYDNLGQFINSANYSFLFSEIGYDKISSDGVLTLQLEWMAQDGLAPVSDGGKKIGSGPYIARFNLKSTASYMADASGEADSYKKGDVIKVREEKTSTFGFKRSKK